MGGQLQEASRRTAGVIVGMTFALTLVVAGCAALANGESGADLASPPGDTSTETPSTVETRRAPTELPFVADADGPTAKASALVTGNFNGLKSPALVNLNAASLQATFAQRGPGWAGGDLMDVVDLPDGRRLWIFADTFFGGVDATGALTEDHRMVHSSAVLQEGDAFQVVETDDGWGWVSSSPDGTWLWPQEAMADQHYLYVFLVKVEHRPGARPGLDFRAVGGSLAVFDLDDLSHPMLVLPDVPGVERHAFGWGVVTHEDHHYLYAHGEGTDTYVARAPKGKLPNFHLWTYWDGTAWGADPALAASVHGLHLRVAEHADGGLVAAGLPFGDTSVQLFTAASPVGPFVGVGTASVAAVEPGEPSWGYSPLIAPGADGGSVLLVNFLPWDMTAITRDIQVLGPRFVDLPPGVPGPS